MSETHWNTRILHWDRIKPPLRPHQNSINTQINLVGDKTNYVLVLGMTPELTGAFENVTAVDKEPRMVEHFWKGDSANRRGILADWFDVDLPDSYFTAIVGDGSLNLVGFPNGVSQLLEKLLGLMAPGGVFTVRAFSRPDEPVSKEDVLTNGLRMPLDAFRCYLNMHIASTEGTVIPSKRMLQVFNDLFPDRIAICEKTGWDINDVSFSMDAYRNSTASTAYPTKAQWLSTVPSAAVDARMVVTSGYPLAENYPVLTFRKSS